MSTLPRCWGIGLARTGNTSFCAALKLLGYESVRQDPAFDELRNLEAGAGNTVVLHFKYLDHLFPGSKFVLTTRPVGSWLRSMEYAHRQDPRPIEGEHERIARRMAIYEHVAYEENTLATAFERHHREVHRYFEGRDGRLLELDASSGQGWDQLCPFLGISRPDALYPKLNQGASA